jgi:hypothetical protein
MAVAVWCGVWLIAVGVAWAMRGGPAVPLTIVATVGGVAGAAAASKTL